MRARANTAMAPNDDRGDDTCESDRIAPDARRTDSEHPDSDPLEPITSNEELERFASFTEAIRDALGESGRIKELRPDEAAERGCLSTLRSLHRRGRAELTVNLCTSAAKGGQLEVLEWLRENECPWDKNTCKEAASGGHLEVLMWARERLPVGREHVQGGGVGWPPRGAAVGARERLPVDEETCWPRRRRPPRGTAVGARERLPAGREHVQGGAGGPLEVLQWARENGCPWNGNMWAAAQSGHLEVLQWARENGCPWNEETCWDAAQGMKVAT